MTTHFLSRRTSRLPRPAKSRCSQQRDHSTSYVGDSSPPAVPATCCATDCRPRRTFLHLSYSCAAPCGPALLVTQDPNATCTTRPTVGSGKKQFSVGTPVSSPGADVGYRVWVQSHHSPPHALCLHRHSKHRK